MGHPADRDDSHDRPEDRSESGGYDLAVEVVACPAGGSHDRPEGKTKQRCHD